MTSESEPLRLVKRRGNRAPSSAGSRHIRWREPLADGSLLSRERELISLVFRKKRRQADSCDVSLTCTPTTTISATGGGALSRCPHRAPNVYSTLRYFSPSKACFARQRAWDLPAHLFTAESVNGRRIGSAPVANTALRHRSG